MKKKFPSYFCFGILLFSVACKQQAAKNSLPITMQNAATIVTETDSNFLKNIVEDISPTKIKYSKQTAAASLQKIDLEKKQDSLTNKTITDNTTKGTLVELGEGAEVMIAADATIEKIGSKFIIKTSASADNLQLKISGMEAASIQQRVFTNLAITLADSTYLLSELPVSTGDWITLPNNNNLFISSDKNAYAYRMITHEKIVLATDRALRKAGKNKKEIETSLNIIAKTNSANDAPCKILFNSCQWKIKGIVAGKSFEKVIQLELN